MRHISIPYRNNAQYFIKIDRILKRIAQSVGKVGEFSTDRQHTLTPALDLPRTWPKKVDYYNLGVNIADAQCRFLPMYDRKCAGIFNKV